MLLKIKEIRNKKNITQDDLALKTGLSKRMIVDYEKEVKDIPLQKLQLIATVLECSIVDLLNLPTPYKIFETLEKVEEPTDLERLITFQGKMIDELKQDKEDLKKDKRLLTSLIETKLGNQEAS